MRSLQNEKEQCCILQNLFIFSRIYYFCRISGFFCRTCLYSAELISSAEFWVFLQNLLIFYRICYFCRILGFFCRIDYPSAEYGSIITFTCDHRHPGLASPTCRWLQIFSSPFTPKGSSWRRSTYQQTLPWNRQGCCNRQKAMGRTRRVHN